MSFETKKNIITDKIVSLDSKLKFDEDKPFPLNGHIIAIFSGRRGSGKSTLLSTLAGIYTPSSGYVDIDYEFSIPIIQTYSV
jgi:ABC-type sulfate/molybdate transport systems ATPase subunit